MYKNISLNLIVFIKMDNNLVQIEKIVKQETDLGITLEKFKKKYVFSHLESSEAFYYNRFAPSPSQLIGFTKT